MDAWMGGWMMVDDGCVGSRWVDGYLDVWMNGWM